MARKMLIDSTHPEETRVVVVNGNKVEEFDFDASSQSLITGNIYLAKVSRVEPSLQAAFVDYGGNRQGFLAFSEIHPDYYQIPQADREALMKEELERQAEEAALEEEDEENTRERGNRSASNNSKSRRTRRSSHKKTMAEDTGASEALKSDEIVEEDTSKRPENDDRTDEASDNSVAVDEGETEYNHADEKPKPKRRSRKTKSKDDAANAEEALENEVASDDDVAALEKLDGVSANDHDPANEEGTQSATSLFDDPREASSEIAEPPEEVQPETDDVEEDIRPKPSKKTTQRPYNRYKIQEVIKPRQILLVQVLKEERGNKGAALTTYISLPGRYCVLMPNTGRGGGISRKISNINDRKRLRSLARGFNVPQGAGLIIRTAGAKQDAEEIERDYGFLTRQWNQIRELTLSSTAPAPVYEESGPIKRAIRDLLTSDMDEILVEGDTGYHEVKSYMEVLMPERVKDVKRYDSKMPLFSRYQVENYLSSMFNPMVKLKSGGYLVIGVTEALVAIDVNSGRSTKEASIEDTALKTNLEAAEEVARQLKLRDLAGLIVIDFIDMEQHRHRQDVENKLKECLRKDRARIQVGRISSFGLLEMSRQRLRTGLVEAITTPCPHCQGTGITRSDDSIALSVIRGIEEEIARGRVKELNAKVSPDIANYLFNEKRDYLSRFVDQYGVMVRVTADVSLHNGEFQIDKIKGNARIAQKQEPVSAASVIEQSQAAEAGETNERGEKSSSNSRRRRGGRGRKRGRDHQNKEATDANLNETVATESAEAVSDGGDEEQKPKSSRKRSKADDRKKPADEGAVAQETKQETKDDGAPVEDGETKPAKKRRTPSLKKAEEAPQEQVIVDHAEDEKPKRTRRKKADAVEDVSTNGEEANEKPKRKRRTKAEIEADKAKKSAQADGDEPKEKPKRKRRTKAEIEADKAKKEAESSASESQSGEKDAPKKNHWWNL